MRKLRFVRVECGYRNAAAVHGRVVRQRLPAFGGQKAIRRNLGRFVRQPVVVAVQHAGRAALVRVLVAYQAELVVLQMLAPRVQVDGHKAAFVAEQRAIVVGVVAFHVILEVDRLDGRVFAFGALVFGFLLRWTRESRRWEIGFFPKKFFFQ